MTKHAMMTAAIMISRSDRRLIGDGPRAVVLALSMVLGALYAFPSATQQAARPPEGNQAGAPLAEIFRTTIANLRNATRDGASTDEARRALSGARQGFETLADAKALTLPDSLRNELHAAASKLAELANTPPSPGSSSLDPFLALLERLRPHLGGDLAPGLNFEGSFSQSRPKEPVYGGHASAMGPAPARWSRPMTGRPFPSRSKRARA